MDGQRLYGFLIDCTGHDINSFSQVREMKIIYHLKFRQYAENLGTVMKEINQAIFDEYGVRRPLSAGLVFSLNREQEKLTYCSAGIQNFVSFVITDMKPFPWKIISSAFPERQYLPPVKCLFAAYQTLSLPPMA